MLNLTHPKIAINPILAHKWGVCAGEDRIWAEVSGRAPSEQPWRRWFVVVQAYFDDSYTEGGVHVLAGYMARAEDWAAFSREWEELLPKCYSGRNGKPRFKMSEMTRRMDEVAVFYNTIRAHASYAFTVMMREEDLERAKGRIWSDNAEILWSPHDDIANLMVRFFVSKFFDIVLGDHHNNSWIGHDDKVDIYLDNNIAEDWALDEWDKIVNQLPEYFREHVGERPRFVDDEQYLPIQAADLLAWWMREGYENNNLNIIRERFGTPELNNNPLRGVNLTFDEDQITSNLIAGFRTNNNLANIFDSHEKPRHETAFRVYDFDKRQNFFSFLAQKIKNLRR
jgi:hypothetical protein